MKIEKVGHGFVVLQESSTRPDYIKATIHNSSLKSSTIVERLEKFNEPKEIFIDIEIDEENNTISTVFIGTNKIKTREAIVELENIDAIIFHESKPKQTYRDAFESK